MTSHKCHGLLSHPRTRYCLFNSLFRLTTKIHQNFELLRILRGIHRWISNKRANNAQEFPQCLHIYGYFFNFFFYGGGADKVKQQIDEYANELLLRDI